jgi:hypothetical protein
MVTRQTFLDFGPVDHHHLVHGRHGNNVAVCTRDPHNAKDARWTERVYSHDDSEAVLLALASNTDHDLYFSQNGIGGKRRTIPFIHSLATVWLDLDIYNIPGLADIDAEGLLERVLSELPWLPIPTFICNSGRGVYFEWALDKPLHRDGLPRWQAVIDALIDQHKPLAQTRPAGMPPGFSALSAAQTPRAAMS